MLKGAERSKSVQRGNDTFDAGECVGTCKSRPGGAVDASGTLGEDPFPQLSPDEEQDDGQSTRVKIGGEVILIAEVQTRQGSVVTDSQYIP